MRLTRDEVEKILSTVREKKLAVIGDICLDRYITGNIEAISREAPVPIVRIETDLYLPGGGGNTTLNVQALGAEAYPVGVIGDDLSAEIIFQEFNNRGIHTEYLIKEPQRHTVCYSKIYASSFHGKKQQVSRFDQQSGKPISQESEALLLKYVDEVVALVDGIIVADYAEVKGTGSITPRVLSHLSQLCRQTGRVFIGDSRDKIGEFNYFTAVVPNEYEAAMASGLYEPDSVPYIDDQVTEHIGRKLQEKIQAHYVIVTRGELGATVVDSSGKVSHVPTVPAAGEIDVTGAGDCFAAALLAALLADIEIIPAVEFANLAAGITVKKLHLTGTASPDEIRKAYTKFLSCKRAKE